ncbi:sulfatase [Lignipirellula cremea]|uniref:Choline-sulfatase n=1 Tax=Lignipirellula cremea TaxID=2528010 RepID=A0A518DNR8_9BACT|nr:sulfatase [Lignipirellula cremea]QDU93480.1 Choline-sulfatase [Lignipirellula cremea]
MNVSSCLRFCFLLHGLLLSAGLLMGAWLPVAGLAQETAAPVPDANRWNVLFLAIDDLRPELGCYGTPGAHSPNLDKLAAEGVLFRNHYVQVPTCGASRYALLTGRSPWASGVVNNNEAAYRGAAALQNKVLPGAQSAPELFRRSGYRTVCLGKISHTPDGRVFAYDGSGDGRPELPNAWDELPTPFGPWKRGWGSFFAYAGGKHRQDGKGHSDLMEFVAQQDDDLPDGMLAGAAVEQLRELKTAGQPFFLAVGFYKPHLPFVATQADWEAFADTDLSLDAEKVDSPHWHRSGEFFRYQAPFEKTQPLSAEAVAKSRRAYYACVRYVDRQVGRVLQELEDLDLADRTVVVVWGDHGWHLGEQQIWGKHSPFERANRSVLLMRVPGQTGAQVQAKGGIVTDALAESIDLYPTLIDLCRPSFQKTAWPLSGQSLVPVLTGTADAGRQAALSYWGKTVSIRTASQRLIWDRKSDRCELYDMTKDPEQTTDLATARPITVARLKALAEERWRQDAGAAGPSDTEGKPGG